MINLFVEIGLAGGAACLILAGCTYVVGYLSWVAIERPFLRKKNETISPRCVATSTLGLKASTAAITRNMTSAQSEVSPPMLDAWTEASDRQTEKDRNSMSRRFRVSRLARAELDVIWKYIAEDHSIEAAGRTVDGIADAFIVLRKRPVDRSGE